MYSSTIVGALTRVWIYPIRQLPPPAMVVSSSVLTGPQHLLPSCAYRATVLFGNDDQFIADLVAGGQDSAPLWWSTVPRSMATLLQVITGDSWTSQIARPMGEVNAGAWLFIAFVFLVIGLGLLNLLSAIFVDSLLTLSAETAQKVASSKAERMDGALDNVAELFQMCDPDGSGEIDREELSKAVNSIHDEKWAPILSDLEMSADDVQTGLENLEFVENADGVPVVYYEDFEGLFKKTDEPATRSMVQKVEKRLQKSTARLEKMEKRINQADLSVNSLFSKVDEIIVTLASIQGSGGL